MPSNHYANKPFRPNVGDYVTDEYDDEGIVSRLIPDSDGATCVVDWEFHGGPREEDTNELLFVKRND